MILINKKIIRACIVSIAIILFSCMTVLANEQPEILTLDRCIEITLEQNTDMMQAKEDQEIARSKIVNAWSTALPKVTLSSSFRRTGCKAPS